MIDTMQSWNDNLTILHPGYRDRIVHISHTEDEGGLNLNMPKETIQRLAQRGAAAGAALTEKFDPATGDGWNNHLWVRYRVLLAMLSDQAASIRNALDPSQHPTLLQLLPDPPSYKLEASQQPIAARVNETLVDLADQLGVEGALAERAPHPRTDLRGRPRSG